MRIRAWLRERCHAWTIAFIEAIDDRRPSRLLLFLACLVLARRSQQRAGDPTGEAIEFVETLLKQQRSVPDKHCSNNLTAKTSEVRSALDVCAQAGSPLRAALDELYQMGAFRHDHDVAFAAIVIERRKMTLDEVFSALAKDYAEIEQRCDPVYPPS